MADPQPGAWGHSSPHLSDHAQSAADMSSTTPGKLFIGGLSWETTNDSLLNYFSTFGTVVEHMVMRDQYTGRSRGFGFVRFADSAVVDQVVQKEHYIDGKKVDPKVAVPKEDQSQQELHDRVENKNKVFVGHVPITTTQDQFRQFFEQFGPVVAATLIHDKATNKSRGFGFVSFATEEGYLKSLNAHEATISDQFLDIKPAERRHARQKPETPFGAYYDMVGGREYASERFGRRGAPRSRGPSRGRGRGGHYWANGRYRNNPEAAFPPNAPVYPPYGFGYVYGQQDFGRPNSYDPASGNPSAFYGRPYPGVYSEYPQSGVGEPTSGALAGAQSLAGSAYPNWPSSGGVLAAGQAGSSAGGSMAAGLPSGPNPSFGAEAGSDSYASPYYPYRPSAGHPQASNPNLQPYTSLYGSQGGSYIPASVENGSYLSTPAGISQSANNPGAAHGDDGSGLPTATSMGFQPYS
ncbi:hypothetical protein H4R33_001092 [Dimargaris cristalligena]|nr:hypothetical protein H4R33_001092 [Dimargaris cristalligena]